MPGFTRLDEPLPFRNLSPQSAQRTQRKIENEEPLSIFLSARSVISVVKFSGNGCLFAAFGTHDGT